MHHGETREDGSKSGEYQFTAENIDRCYASLLGQSQQDLVRNRVHIRQKKNSILLTDLPTRWFSHGRFGRPAMIINRRSGAQFMVRVPKMSFLKKERPAAELQLSRS